MIVLLLACHPAVTVLLEDRNNYDFTSDLSVDVTVVPPQTDSLVDWSELTQDFLGQPLDPATDITSVLVIRFANLTEDEVVKGINEENISSENVFPFSYDSGGTSAHMTQFDLSGTFIDPGEVLVEDGGAYLVSAKSDFRFRMVEMFRPVSGADDVPVVLRNDSAHIDFDVTLDAGEAVELPAHDTNITLDWADLTMNGSDLPIDLPNIDRLVLARFDEDTAALEGDFLHFDALADERFEIDTSGFASAKLSRATAADGTVFDGFDDRTWFMALLCSTCVNPAPAFLARVTVP
jgi:hypothetical protein